MQSNRVSSAMPAWCVAALTFFLAMLSGCGDGDSPSMPLPTATVVPPSATATATPPPPTSTPCPIGTPCPRGYFQNCSGPISPPPDVCHCSSCMQCPLPECPGGSIGVCDGPGAINSCETVCHCEAVTPTATPDPNLHRISGRVFDGGCVNGTSGETVALQPLDRTTVTAADGSFAFDSVGDGAYELLFGAGGLSKSWAVAGRDEVLSFCIECPTSLELEPRHGPAGTTVDVSGGPCYPLHSGRQIAIEFDGARLATFPGSQSGDYQGTIMIPPEALPGPHTLRLPRAGDFPNQPGEIATAQFIVDP